MIYPDNIEKKIDFGAVRQHVRQFCHSEQGREQTDAIVFLSDSRAIRSRLAETWEMLRLLQDGSCEMPQGEISDLRGALARIRVEGLFLDEAELFALRKTLDYAARLEQFFTGLDTIRYPIISRWRIEESADHRGLLSQTVRAIDAILDPYGQLRDNASPELGRIRHELTLAQGAVSRAIQSVLKQAQAAGLLDKDTAPTLREGRLVLPVPPAYKKKIGGIVHDESATGKTVFVEPQQVVEANNRIRSLENEEKRERIKILTTMAQRLRPCTPDLLRTEAWLGHIDFVRAKALSGKELNAILPTVEDQPMIDWHSARHAVLYLRFKEEKKEVVPLDLKLGDPNTLLIISGPNAGGKSVCLKTVALTQYMLQCGLLVPMDESSTMGLFKHIMIDIGDEQSINDDLSTYSSHLRNMKAFVRNADKDTLFLIDEAGSGTEPAIGGAMAESILCALHERHAVGVVTTHYTNLKHLAEKTEGMINGAMLYDRGALRPLFRLSIGQAGSSFAIEIARQIGLPEDIIAHTAELVGEEHIDYDKQLQDIARDKRYWENKRQNIRLREKHLEEKITYYENEIAGLKQQKKTILDSAKEEAADLLRRSNATIERTIREIKEAKADKAVTQRARKRVEKMKATTRPAEPVRNATDGKKVLRDFKELRFIAKDAPHLLQETPQGTIRPTNVADEMRRKKLSFSRELDLRGLRADEALDILAAYIDDAIMVGADKVSILHGTGTGALKQLTRDYLATLNRRKKGNKTVTEKILDFHDGDPDRGGAGITIVEL